ncbi:metallophosphoesterase [Aquibacillus kalidii]|uniref:metallophosphoesterase n=1 Tax=Aquibacillus kalidii TaxID=2762597 RepID=UPI001644BFB4|nr:metallophosphoesterase [Aquibacillus kalidii]
MNRRTFLKKLITSSLALFGLGGGTYYYAREIEPGMLTIKEADITSHRIPISFDNFKIVQFSDTHIGFHYTLDQFEELVNTINKHNPDCVVFTGDLVDRPDQFKWDNRIIKSLSNINAPYGKYWIYGNHDHGGYGTDIIKEVMDKSDFVMLKNANTKIDNGLDRFVIAGLDDVMLGAPNLDHALEGSNPELFTLLLCHEPDYAEVVQQFPVDVQLSGHSHGGQVQIPFFGYIYTPTLAESYVEGKYSVGLHPLQLYVSRGIGTTRLPYRFLCKPELNIYRLAHDD